MKIDFKDNLELQNIIIEDVSNGLPIKSLTEKYPEYSLVTYKRFLRSKGIKSKFDRNSKEFVDKMRDSCRKAWADGDEEKKTKHIERLRKLADSQKDIPVEHSEEWKRKNIIHMKKVNSEHKKTMLERYGKENASQVEQFKNNRKNTYLEKYGKPHFYQTETFKEKSKKTSLERYGVENPTQCPEIQEKIRQTMANNNYSSKPEQEIGKFIESLNLTYTKSYIGGKRPFELDILIKEKSIAIEYNGDWWHSEYNKNITKDYHLYKTEECLKQNIQLIHIFGDEWKYRQNAVKDFISSKLGIFKERIYARKCEIREVEDTEAKEFLDKYHIRGRVNSFLRFGLYYENRLVALATFSRPHRQNMEPLPHLSRFACFSGTQVIGGLSRLSKAALKRIGPFVTFVERQRSEGNSYLKAGYIKVKTLGPDYWYTNGNKTISKQSRRKSAVNTPKEMTETEHALKDGLYRIWDCGKYKFIYGNLSQKDGIFCE